LSESAFQSGECGEGLKESGETCIPCRLATEPLASDQVRARMAELPDGWLLEFLENGATRLKKRYKTRNFVQSLDWVNRMGSVAEALDHHPDIAFGWGWIEITLWTHKVNGLTDADFLLARKIESVLKDQDTVF